MLAVYGTAIDCSVYVTLDFPSVPLRFLVPHVFCSLLLSLPFVNSRRLVCRTYIVANHLSLLFYICHVISMFLSRAVHKKGHRSFFISLKRLESQSRSLDVFILIRHTYSVVIHPKALSSSIELGRFHFTRLKIMITTGS